MIKKIFTLLALFSAMTATTYAQETLYLMKGDKTVASYKTDEIDYVTFHRPAEAHPTTTFTITPKGEGKDYLSFRIAAQDENQSYLYSWIPKCQVEYVLQQLNDETIETADDVTLKSALRYLVGISYVVTKGSQTCTVKNGEDDAEGTPMFVAPGQDYYIVAVDVDEDIKLGSSLTYITMKTADPTRSSESLSVAYNGLNSEGNALFQITPSSGIKTFYAVFGKDKALQQWAATMGQTEMLLTLGYYFTPAEWNSYSEEDRAWEIDGEDDYSLYVLAVDAKGDTLMAQCTQHIQGENAYDTPKIELLSKEASDGTVKACFEITPSNVTGATVRLMKEDDVSNQLNAGKTLLELATSDEATDITSEINSAGEYTFSQTDLSRGWYTLLVSGTNDKGSTVMQASFHSHLSDATWEVNNTAFPNQSTAVAKPFNNVSKKAVKFFGSSKAKLRSRIR